VVLLHAFPLSSLIWHRLVPLLDGVRVVSVDLPGLGRSVLAGEASDEPTMSSMAGAVLSVLDHLDVEEATILGISTGGYVALEMARTAPERVASLALASTTCWLIEPDLPAERREVADEIVRQRSIDPVLGSADAGLGRTARREQPDLHPFLVGLIEAADPEGVAWAARAIASRHDTEHVLRDMDRPVLLLFGAEDDATPPERGAAMQRLRGEDADTTLVVLEGTGHLSALEQPARVAAVLRSHLEHLAHPAGSARSTGSAAAPGPPRSAGSAAS